MPEICLEILFFLLKCVGNLMRLRFWTLICFSARSVCTICVFQFYLTISNTALIRNNHSKCWLVPVRPLCHVRFLNVIVVVVLYYFLNLFFAFGCIYTSQPYSIYQIDFTATHILCCCACTMCMFVTLSAVTRNR